MSDDINSPAHYTKGGIECIDYLRAKMSHEEFVGFVRGNAIKYLTRMMDKNDAFEDAKKAAWYCCKLVQTLDVVASQAKKDYHAFYGTKKDYDAFYGTTDPGTEP